MAIHDFPFTRRDGGDADRVRRDLVPARGDLGAEPLAAGGATMNRALLISIDEYRDANDLSGCAADAAVLKSLPARHEDGVVR
jgi:hypothetical protein